MTIRSTVVTLSLLFILAMTNSNAKPVGKKQRFESAASQFANTWRVDSYDLRNFTGEVLDIDAKMKEEAGFFPIGQHIRFDAGGIVALPGSIDPVSMRARGPVGEELTMTILHPFEKKLCGGYWHYMCNENSDYHANLMISGIWNWSTMYPERLTTWQDMNPVSYTVLHLAKSYNFDTWFAKNGDLMIGLYLDSPAKNGRDGGIMAVRLKAVER